jgi:hypothetical protein
MASAVRAAYLKVWLMNPALRKRRRIARAAECTRLAHSVRRELTRLRYEPHVTRDASRVLRQLDGFETRLVGFDSLLRDRLPEDDAEVHAFLEAQEQAYLALLRGMREAISLIGEIRHARTGPAGGEPSHEIRLSTLLSRGDRATVRLEAIQNSIIRALTPISALREKLAQTAEELERLAESLAA